MTVSTLTQGVLAGQRRALSKAITLIESTRNDHRVQAEEIINALMPHTDNAVRIGLTGIPGVGKSTLIESFGLFLIEQGYRPAILAVDPSSPVTGGSILGDKTRMEMLSRDPRAFIRPSPSSCTLGGVARRTREAMLLCEAAGHDVILVETVGVGQSETAVAGMVDLFMLLVAPGAGDELQGIKKGIVELADMVVVTKADGDLADAAARAARDYSNALHLIGHVDANGNVPVVTCSSTTGTGIDLVWAGVQAHIAHTKAHGIFNERRHNQAQAWMWNEITETLVTDFKSDESVAPKLKECEALVGAGTIAPGIAARTLVGAFKRQTYTSDVDVISSARPQEKPSTMPQLSQDSLALKQELLGLFGHLQKIRRELAALNTAKDSGDDHFSSMSEQLDAIIDATENATNTIMENCEGIEVHMEESRAKTQDPELLAAFDNVTNKVNNIFEACAFQDITGQRVTKVVHSLKFVEERINAIILAWGQEELSRVVGDFKEKIADDPDKALLHGPQLQGQGIDQSEVDRLLAQNEIDKLFA